MKLLIAEKPSVAVSSYRTLLEKSENEKFEKKDGYLQGKEWVISWFVGHLVGLAMPEEYNEDWKEWKIENLPMIPEQWKLKTLPNTRKQYNIVSGLMKKADLIVNGTDAGREGELIYRLVVQLAGCSKKPQKRLWVNSFVLKDMLESWRNLKDVSYYNNLAQSAFMRTKGDWLVGLNASRGYILKTGVKNLSVGRVQTPTLNLIHKSKQEYWEKKAKEITLANPESLEFFKYKLELAEKKHKYLKENPEKRTHSYSLTYAKKEVNELKKKLKIAELLWG